MNKPIPSMHIGGAFWQAMKRIMSNEAGVYERCRQSLKLSVDEDGILRILEERRLNGEFENNVPN